MTLTFPRDMPSVGSMSLMFELDRVDYLSPEAGGRLGSISAGFPLWRMSLTLNNMLVRQADIWRAWLPAQRGSQRQFYARDLDRPVPRFHAGGRPFVKTPSSWSQTIDAAGNAVVTLHGIDRTVLSLGDYIGFIWGDTKRSLVRVVEGGAGDASGNLIVTVEPPVPAVTPTNAVANLYKPTCVMRLVTSDTQLGEQVLGGYTAAGGKIVAVQDLRA